MSKNQTSSLQLHNIPFSLKIRNTSFLRQLQSTSNVFDCQYLSELNHLVNLKLGVVYFFFLHTALILGHVLFIQCHSPSSLSQYSVWPHVHFLTVSTQVGGIGSSLKLYVSSATISSPITHRLGLHVPTPTQRGNQSVKSLCFCC